MIDGKNFLNQPIKNDKITYENIRKIATSQGDHYTTGCLLDYNYFKNYYKMIAVDLSKQQALDSDPKAIQQIKACVCYFSLFLKEKCISSLFQTKYIENKFNLQLFFLPIVS